MTEHDHATRSQSQSLLQLRREAVTRRQTDHEGTEELFRRDREKDRLKSGYTKTSHDFIVRTVVWPHNVVYRSAAPTPPATYDSLTLPEFVMGMMRLIESTLPSDNMWVQSSQYLIELTGKAVKFDWPNVRSTDRTVLYSVERGHVDRGDAQGIRSIRDDALREASYARVRPAGPFPTPASYRTPYDTSIHPNQQPCIPYQTRSCSHRTDQTCAVAALTAGEPLGRSSLTLRQTAKGRQMLQQPQKTREGGGEGDIYNITKPCPSNCIDERCA